MIANYFTTLKHLMIQPNSVIYSFVKNEERNYLHPFLFLLLGVIFLIILNTLLVSYPTITSEPIPLDEPVQPEQVAEWIDVVSIRLSTQFFPVMLFLLIPLLSIPGLFFFRNESEGFYSQLIMNSYTIGATMPVLLAAIPLWIFLDIPLSEPLMNTTLPALLVSMIVLWIYRIYLKIPGFIGFIKTASTLITGYLLFMLLKGFTGGIIGYTLFALNRIRELSGA